MVRKKKQQAEQIPLSLYQEEEDKVLGVSEYLDTLNDYIGLHKATVQGEISRVTERGRAVYFTLLDKDDKSALNCLIWTSQLYSQAIELKDGMEVIIQGHPNIYKPTGRLSFMARRIALVGEGALKIAFEKLKVRLETEGYFDQAHKRPIPPYIHSIGLITADGREAQKDFLTFLGSFGYKIRFFDVRVEGINSLDSILAAIRWFNENTRDVEALVLTRGGGGLESLQAFNTEEIAKAIYSSRIPIISAVGHENDVTICDMVADFRASTPTHAGQYLSQPWREAEGKINTSAQSILALFRQKLGSLRQGLDYYQEGIVSGYQTGLTAWKRRLSGQSIYLTQSFKNLILKVKQTEMRYVAHFKRMAMEIGRRKEMLKTGRITFLRESSRWLGAMGKKLENLDAALKQYDPERRLKQGYSIVTDSRGKVMKSTTEVALGDIISVRTHKGSLDSKVEKKY